MAHDWWTGRKVLRCHVGRVLIGQTQPNAWCFHRLLQNVRMYLNTLARTASKSASDAWRRGYEKK